jgi:trans-aconitate 2-methyltransferase
VTSPGYRWDPEQYTRYADERGRPFDDLVARIPVAQAPRVLDVGCGTGNLTRSLLDRWPGARVTGIDSSVDMVRAAEQLADPGRLEFICADLREWRADGPFDVVVSNAVLQWIPGHLDLLPTFVGWLAPGGTLAIQVPDNFTEPSHTILRDVRLSPRWRDRVGGGADRALAVERPETYLDALAGLGLHVDVWQTTYLHRLTGDDPVLEWMKGTALRPVLDRLGDDSEATRDFLAECAAPLREAYPPGPHGTILPFRRTFAVGRKP